MSGRVRRSIREDRQQLPGSSVRRARHLLADLGRPGARSAIDVTRSVAKEWRDDRVSGLAAEVAFFAVLSVFPAVLALAAALGSVSALVGAEAADQAEAALVDGLGAVLGGEGATTTEAVRRLFDDQSPGVLTVAAMAAVVALSRGFAAVIRALDVAYDVDEHRSWLSTRLTALGLSVASVVVAAVLLAVMVVGPLLGGAQEVADLVGMGTAFASAWGWLRIPVAVAVVVAWAATVFHVAPNHQTPWRWDLPGAALTTVVWTTVTAGFRLYLEVAAAGNAVFGVLGGALTLLFWLYLLAIGLLLGGELNAVLAARHGVPQVRRR